eukprot:scaffold6976_cov118-Isochrysis_galbana.AAC.6
MRRDAELMLHDSRCAMCVLCDIARCVGHAQCQSVAKLIQKAKAPKRETSAKPKPEAALQRAFAFAFAARPHGAKRTKTHIDNITCHINRLGAICGIELAMAEGGGCGVARPQN